MGWVNRPGGSMASIALAVRTLSSSRYPPADTLTVAPRGSPDEAVNRATPSAPVFPRLSTGWKADPVVYVIRTSAPANGRPVSASRARTDTGLDWEKSEQPHEDAAIKAASPTSRRE